MSRPGPTTEKLATPTGCLLCRHHHSEVHRGNWEIRFADDGAPEFLPPAWIDPARVARRNTSHHITGSPAAEPVSSRAVSTHCMQSCYRHSRFAPCFRRPLTAGFATAIERADARSEVIRHELQPRQRRTSIRAAGAKWTASTSPTSPITRTSNQPTPALQEAHNLDRQRWGEPGGRRPADRAHRLQPAGAAQRLPPLTTVDASCTARLTTQRDNREKRRARAAPATDRARGTVAGRSVPVATSGSADARATSTRMETPQTPWTRPAPDACTSSRSSD